MSEQSFPSLQELELVCHGYSCFDLNIMTDKALKPGQRLRADNISYNGGGVAANIAVAAARLGCKVGFSGFISHDVLGEIQYQGLSQEQVNMELCTRGITPSPLVAIIASPDGETTLINNSVEKPYLQSIPTNAVKPKVVLMDGFTHHQNDEWLAIAKAINATTVLDAGHFTPGTLELSKKVDIVISSQEFAEKYAQSTDLTTTVNAVSALCDRFIITRDKAGCVWNWEGQLRMMKAWPVDCVDGVGAGDAFHAAFCYGLLNQLSFNDNLLQASAAGAMCCTGLGARDPLPDRDRLCHFMKSQPEPEIVSLK